MKLLPAYDPDDNSRRGYELGIAAAREKCIRNGSILPEPGNATEARWAREGQRRPSELDSVRQEGRR